MSANRSKATLLDRPGRRERLAQYSRTERTIGIAFGGFIGGLAGLMFGVGLACFGLTMWLWLVLPVFGASIGGVLGWNLPVSLNQSKTPQSLRDDIDSI